MDHQYGCDISNKFAFLPDDDDDPTDLLARQEVVKSNKKEDKKAAKSKAKKAETKAKIVEQPIAKKEEKPVSRQNDRGGRGRREPREIGENNGERRQQFNRGFNRDNREGRVANDENVPPEFRERPEGGFRRRDDQGGFREGGFGGERGRGRGRGRGGRGRGDERGGRGGFGLERGGRGGFGERRQFDRHSASDKTGVKATDKRDGGGAHNWGSFKDDLAEPEQQNDSSADWTGQPDPAPETAEAGENVEGTEDGPKEEPEPLEMTLDEWKKLQSQQNKPKPEFNVRLAGEGVDAKQWQKGREYHKKHEDEDEDDEEEESEDEDEDAHHGRGKQVVTDIRITFNDNPRGNRRGGRGGRGRGGMERGGAADRGGEGRGRGRGGPGGPRGFGGKPKEATPQFDNEQDFPSLVKSAA